MDDPVLQRAIRSHQRVLQLTVSLRDQTGDVILARQVSTQPKKIVDRPVQKVRSNDCQFEIARRRANSFSGLNAHSGMVSAESKHGWIR
ncbi:MAG: hypothetical protein SGI77_09665 [Pirellulaceae bacterium]|nr:hypothetical protein [Pirellulaceae bacterium]